MLNSLKSAAATAAGFVFMIVMLVVPVLVLVGAIWAGLTFQAAIQTVNGIVTGMVLILLIASVVPRFREVTSGLIILGTYVWGVTFWVHCLIVTYAEWGVIGVVVGLLLAGLGVILTALAALLLSGEFLIFGLFVLNLAMIWGVRLLAAWISTKHRPKLTHSIDMSGVEPDSTESPDQRL